MRIIKEGKIPELKEYYLTCSRCKTEFSCLQKEFITNHHDQRDGWTRSINCPICHGACYSYE